MVTFKTEVVHFWETKCLSLSTIHFSHTCFHVCWFNYCLWGVHHMLYQYMSVIYIYMVLHYYLFCLFQLVSWFLHPGYESSHFTRLGTGYYKQVSIGWIWLYMVLQPGPLKRNVRPGATSIFKTTSLSLSVKLCVENCNLQQNEAQDSLLLCPLPPYRTWLQV